MTKLSVSFSKSHKYSENLCILSHLRPEQQKNQKNLQKNLEVMKKCVPLQSQTIRTTFEKTKITFPNSSVG